MRLKKTTVLTGNHILIKQRNRAQSENEILFTSHNFKGADAKNNQNQPDASVVKNNSAPEKG